MGAQHVATLAVDVAFFDQGVIVILLEELQMALDVSNNGSVIGMVCRIEANVEEGFRGGENVLLRFLLPLDLVRAGEDCVIVRVVWGENLRDERST